MKNLFKVMILSGILLVGCTNQPNFNPDAKNLRFVGGKPYLIPKNSTFGLTPLNKKLASSMKKNSRGKCKEGDVWWVGLPYGSPGRMVIRASSEQEVQNHFDMRHTGCAHPLSKQEYQYYLNLQNQAAANARAAAYYRAATAPKRVEVRQTGYDMKFGNMTMHY